MYLQYVLWIIEDREVISECFFVIITEEEESSERDETRHRSQKRWEPSPQRLKILKAQKKIL